MSSHFTTLDAVILAAYFVGTMAIGFWFSRASRSPEGFTAASRSLPGWACGLSIFATYLSSISFLALPGKAYATNWNAFVFSLSLPIAAWIAVRWFVPLYRSTGDVSAYAHLERRFGPWARVYVGIFYLLTQLARVGTVMYLMALPLAVLLGWDIKTVILITGISVTLYAFVGGIVAVIWTDALQAVVLTVGALACLAVLFFGMPGGPGQVFEIAEQHDKFSLGSFGSSLATSTFWVVLIYGLFVNLQNFGIDQSYVQRYVASRSEAEARRSVWLGALLYVPVSAVFFLIGTALFAWHQTHPEDRTEVVQAVAADKSVDADKVSDADIGDKAFPHFIGKRLPAGITGLLIAAVFAAGMSTVSTSLNSSATLVLNDYYIRFVNPSASESQSMVVLRGATILWGALGTGIAFLLIQISSALDAWWTLASIFSGGMLGLFLLGLLSRARNPQAICAVVAGLLVIAWMVVSQTSLWPESWADAASPFEKTLAIVLGTLTILFVGLTFTGVIRLFRGNNQ